MSALVYLETEQPEAVTLFLAKYVISEIASSGLIYDLAKISGKFLDANINANRANR